MSTNEWLYRMDWCKANGYPPANSYFWELAGKSYKEQS